MMLLAFLIDGRNFGIGRGRGTLGDFPVKYMRPFNKAHMSSKTKLVLTFLGIKANMSQRWRNGLNG